VALMSLLVSAVHNRFGGLIVILFCGAAWMGIRHLEYAEFAMAGRMFLGGKFRRIIDAETRLLDFQAALGKAADAEECWSKIRAASSDFGFLGVRASLAGMLFEEASSNSRRHWELRIPLSGGDYVNFFQDVGAETDPLILSQFVNAVERGIAAWLAVQPPEPLRMPAAQLYYTAAASPAGKGRAV
jgi:hypothetical protein